MIDQLRGNGKLALDDNLARNIGHRDYDKAAGEENDGETTDQKHHNEATDEKDLHYSTTTEEKDPHYSTTTEEKVPHYSKTTDEKYQHYGQTADQKHRIHGQKVVVQPNEDEVSRAADTALPGRKTDELEPHFITLSE